MVCQGHPVETVPGLKAGLPRHLQLRQLSSRGERGGYALGYRGAIAPQPPAMPG